MRPKPRNKIKLQLDQPSALINNAQGGSQAVRIRGTQLLAVLRKWAAVEHHLKSRVQCPEKSR
jgi:hypothetical protein